MTPAEQLLTEAQILDALRDVQDPELPVNIVDLGLIYEVELAPDPDAPGMLPKQSLRVQVTMTTQACPAHHIILEQARNRLSAFQQLSTISVELVWEPAWTPERMSHAAQKKLGIAPPEGH